MDSVGELLDGTETKFEGSVSPNGPGEICMRGRHLMMGYLNEEEKTMATIDSEGWIHSGDLGRADEHNLLYITGRIKVCIHFPNAQSCNVYHSSNIEIAHKCISIPSASIKLLRT